VCNETSYCSTNDCSEGSAVSGRHSHFPTQALKAVKDKADHIACHLEWAKDT
jgi:hypothetical protein